MATYVPITELEFDALCKSDKGWTKEYQGEELVYLFRVKKNQDIVIKVYSSITKNGLGRKCGKDAIRVCSVNSKTNKGVGKTKRVNRTSKWEERVKSRVMDLISLIR